ncbi:hypothetical protein RRG08_028627 [Elysia crispata]|uniref:Uncharacterized protein n=1 Tax=Elysia crispata TaxID=231223 RepID=A0AAE0ZSW9_9GAST|nr:hypothetical protein RRG08_028627 [Elysia crispata]
MIVLEERCGIFYSKRSLDLTVSPLQQMLTFRQ